MIVIFENRPMVRDVFAGQLRRQGVASLPMDANEFVDWFDAAADGDIEAVEGFILGQAHNRAAVCRRIRARSMAPVIGVNENIGLDGTLELFAFGCDDVVRVPVHPRELLARIESIRRRAARVAKVDEEARLRVFFDGRDPEIDGRAFELPRREKRILEYLARKRGARVTKTQLFNAVYGVLEESVDEAVVESHVSKLRKKLKARLGFDPIEAKRFLGYALAPESVACEAREQRIAPPMASASAPAFA